MIIYESTVFYFANRWGVEIKTNSLTNNNNKKKKTLILKAYKQSFQICPAQLYIKNKNQRTKNNKGHAPKTIVPKLINIFSQEWRQRSQTPEQHPRLIYSSAEATAPQLECEPPRKTMLEQMLPLTFSYSSFWMGKIWLLQCPWISLPIPP